MKKVFIILLFLMLVAGCTSEDTTFEDLGYTAQEKEKILTLSEINQEPFKSAYDKEGIDIITNANFKEENLFKYRKYYGDFALNKMIVMVNNGKLNDDTYSKLYAIYHDKCFLDRYENKYISYLDEYDDMRSLVEFVNCKRFLPDYDYSKATDTSYGNLMLVNKYNYLSNDYVPDDLVQIPSNYGGGQIKKEVFEAYKLMYEDALKAGLYLTINSAYRSYQTQVYTYNNFLTIDPQDVVDTYSARPGYSEHQTGLALDVLTPGTNFGNFHLSDAAKWMKENCYKYGFIIRYPDNKIDLTGYKYEAWHIRYLGDIAKDVYESGLVYDEYYAVNIEGK